jgi:hypothetical protein
MNSKMRAFARETRRDLKKWSSAIYEAFYANASDEEMLKDLAAKQARLREAKPGEDVFFAVQYPDGSIGEPMKVTIQNQKNN